MASPTQIRRAGLADAEHVGVLTERVYRRGGWGSERYSRALLDGRSRIEDAIVLVATVDEAIVGTVTVALPETTMAHMAHADEVEVRMLAVDEAARGRGIANLLMEECETLAKAQGVKGVVLCTEPDMYAAHRLYQRRGYVRQPDRDWEVDGTPLMAYRLQV